MKRRIGRWFSLVDWRSRPWLTESDTAGFYRYLIERDDPAHAARQEAGS